MQKGVEGVECVWCGVYSNLGKEIFANLFDGVRVSLETLMRVSVPGDEAGQLGKQRQKRRWRQRRKLMQK